MSIIFMLMTLAAAVAAYKVLKEINQQYKCIEDIEIIEYKRGLLHDDYRRQITMHLGVCKKCQQRMIELDPDDTINHLID